jgi:hypothetical protein
MLLLSRGAGAVVPDCSPGSLVLSLLIVLVFVFWFLSPCRVVLGL